jgi:LmbE family N-acetylglucosaminyl deacetylase
MRSRRPLLPHRRVVVLSPHLDDGVFSLGAAVAASSRRGVDVRMLTVFAGDPESTVPAGDWDRRSGFATAGEAAGARRLEDVRACALVGATPVWLPFSDEQYERGGDGSTVWAAIVEAAGAPEAILIPGSPLKHADHRWLNALFEEKRFPGARVGVYREQPYAGLLRDYRGRELPPAAAGLRASPRDWLAKVRACRAYTTQIPLFGRRLAVEQVVAYELRQGGEQVAWLDDGPRR